MRVKVFICLCFLLSCVFSDIKAQTPTWSDTIACIIYTNCTNCHNQNGIAPFSLETYNDAYANRYWIQFAINSGIMPPWPPDENYSNFAHERTLTNDEITLINDWVNGNAPHGNPADAPPIPTYSGEEISNPDLVIQAPTWTSTATTADDYRCFTIANPLNYDTYITGFEVIPSNREIIHHVLIFQDNNIAAGQNYQCFGGTGMGTSDYISSYTPGQAADFYPPGMGIKLEANTTLILQLHYPAGTAGEVDSTKINFQLDTGPLREVSVEFILFSTAINIPANTTQTITQQFTIPIDVTVVQVFPHMHLIGQSIKSWAVTPTNETIPLIDVPQWDFEWQGNYNFDQLVKVPAGSTLYGEGFYDNTTNNPHNPNNPPQTVTFGEETTDEMFIVAFGFTPYLAGDENIVVYDTKINYCDTVSTCEDLSGGLDTDGDGVFDWCDNCPNVKNSAQWDINGTGIGDACECLTNNNFTIDYATNYQDDFEVSNSITASNLIPSSAIVDWDAGNEIVLQDGFWAESGSEFHAFIEGCGGVLKEENQNPNIEKNIQNLSIYPNPSNGKTFVQFENIAEQRGVLCLFDIQGKKIADLYEGEILEDAVQFDTNFLNRGIYIVQLQLKTGEKFSEKLVVK